MVGRLWSLPKDISTRPHHPLKNIISVKAGIHCFSVGCHLFWTPAYAGVTTFFGFGIY
jgi:hypothetical protein